MRVGLPVVIYMPGELEMDAVLDYEAEYGGWVAVPETDETARNSAISTVRADRVMEGVRRRVIAVLGIGPFVGIGLVFGAFAVRPDYVPAAFLLAMVAYAIAWTVCIAWLYRAVCPHLWRAAFPARGPSLALWGKLPAVQAPWPG